MYYFPYNLLIQILTYCDVETSIRMLDIRDDFVFTANMLSIRRNIDLIGAKLESMPTYEDLASSEELKEFNTESLEHLKTTIE